jgi:hypothetical protein
VVNGNGSSFPFTITAKGKHSVQLKKPGYHPARLHNGKSRGFLNSLLKDKVALHPNGGEFSTAGRSGVNLPLSRLVRRVLAREVLSRSGIGEGGHPSPAPVTTAVPFAPFRILMSYSPWTYFLSVILTKKKRDLSFFCFNFVAEKKGLPLAHM